jgi:FkbM family methyltransferase
MWHQLRALWENRRFDNALQLFVDRVIGRPTGLTVYRLGEYRILVDHRGEDQVGTRGCLVDGVYDALLAPLSLPRRLSVLDLGANGGGFPLLLGALGHTFERLVCVELNPNTCARLAFNIGTNLGRQHLVLNAAVAAANGEVAKTFGLGSVSERVERAAPLGVTPERVPLLTFDEIVLRGGFPNGIDLCKMDVEGAEFEVLLGSTATSLAQCRHLLLELHDPEGGGNSRVRALLRGLGFEELGCVRQQYEVCLFAQRSDAGGAAPGPP